MADKGIGIPPSATKRLFQRFSVFARGANLEQAEAVCGGDLGVDVLSGLDELADQSLLRRMPDFEEPRLLMLQVVREYAADRLEESGEAAGIRDRHAAAYEELAETAAPHLFGFDPLPRVVGVEVSEREAMLIRADGEARVTEKRPFEPWLVAGDEARSGNRGQALRNARWLDRPRPSPVGIRDRGGRPGRPGGRARCPGRPSVRRGNALHPVPRRPGGPGRRPAHGGGI